MNFLNAMAVVERSNMTLHDIVLSGVLVGVKIPHARFPVSRQTICPACDVRPRAIGYLELCHECAVARRRRLAGDRPAAAPRCGDWLEEMP